MRGTATNATGDEVDDNTTPVAGLADIPAGLIEVSKDVFDPASGTRRTVRIIRARIRGNITVLEGDRIKDLKTSRIYAIDEKVTVPRSLAGQSSLTLDLRDTNAEA